MPYPDAVIAEYREAIEGKDPTYHYLAEVDQRPIGMLQHYRIADSPEYAEALRPVRMPSGSIPSAVRPTSSGGVTDRRCSGSSCPTSRSRSTAPACA